MLNMDRPVYIAQFDLRPSIAEFAMEITPHPLMAIHAQTKIIADASVYSRSHKLGLGIGG